MLIGLLGAAVNWCELSVELLTSPSKAELIRPLGDHKGCRVRRLFTLSPLHFPSACMFSKATTKVSVLSVKGSSGLGVFWPAERSFQEVLNSAVCTRAERTYFSGRFEE